MAVCENIKCVNSPDPGGHSKENWILPNEVYHHLFSFLDVESLISARQVCHLWNKNVLLVLKKKWQLRLRQPLSYNRWTDLITTMKNADELPFSKLWINIASGSRFDKIYELFDFLGQSIEELRIIYECCGNNGNYKFSLSYNDLEYILNCCKKLTFLSMASRFGSNCQEEFVMSDSCETSFNTIETLNLIELIVDQDKSDFSYAKEILPKFAKQIPNIIELNGWFGDQIRFDEFVENVKLCRQNGQLKLVDDLAFTGESTRKLFFTQNHLESLIAMKLPLTHLNILGVVFSGCDAINRQDISYESMYNFFNEANKSLKLISIGSISLARRTNLPIGTLGFPVMNALESLYIICCNVIDILPLTNLMKLFPKLKHCEFSTGFEPEFLKFFPYLTENWSSFRIKNFTKNGKDEESRKIKFRHNTIDYYFSKPGFFKDLSLWFPNIAVFSVDVKVHFGVLNLLRGLRHLNVMEIELNIDCEVCKHGKSNNKEEKRAEDKYVSIFQYDSIQFSTDNPNPYPELRFLKIWTSNCDTISFQYLRKMNVMEFIVAGPKLESFTITSDLPGCPGKYVAMYQK